MAATCGASYSSFINVGSTAPTSPYTDSAVVNAMCYIYRYVVTDAVGNQTIVTSANVAKVDYAGAVNPTTSAISQWRLGEASGTTMVDSVTSVPNNGTYVNAPTFGVTGAIANDANKATLYNGVDEYSSVPREISGDLSIEFWLKTTQNYIGNLYGQPSCSQWWQGAGLVDADLSGGAQDFGVSMCAGKIIAGVGVPEISVVSPGTYNDNRGTTSSSRAPSPPALLALYVDGVLVGTTTANTGLLNATANLNFGRSAAGVNYFAGTLDEVAVYNVALPAGTVSDHYQLGVSPPSDTTGPTGGSVDATRSRRDGFALLDVDEPQHRLHSRHRPERPADERAHPDASDGDSHRRDVRQLRQLRARHRRHGPDLTEGRHRDRRRLLPVPVHGLRHPRQHDHLHERRHQGRRHGAVDPDPRHHRRP